jgi:threonine aldolase
MTAPSNKIALYIDGANLHATARTLGFEISTACARCWSVTVSSYDRRGVDSHVLRTPSDV